MRKVKLEGASRGFSITGFGVKPSMSSPTVRSLINRTLDEIVADLPVNHRVTSIRVEWVRHDRKTHTLHGLVHVELKARK